MYFVCTYTPIVKVTLTPEWFEAASHGKDIVMKGQQKNGVF